MSRRAWRRAAGAATLALPLAAAAIAVARFDPNDYKDALLQAIEASTGRTLTVKGPLRLSRSLWPTLQVNDVALANLPGGSRPDLAHAERIEGQISLLALLWRRIEITQLTLIGPNILFEQVGGQSNWIFSRADPPAATNGPASPARPAFDLRIRSVHVQNGMVTWRLPARTKVVGIRSLDYANPAGNGPITAKSTLVYADNQPFRLDLAATPTGGVMAPWTTRLDFAAFDTVASLTGTADIAGHYDLQVAGTAGTLAQLNALLPEMNLPNVRQARIDAHIVNGERPGDIPVIGPARLQFASADLQDIVPGLSLGAMDATLPQAGAAAAVSGAGRYNATPFKLDGSVVVPVHPDGKVVLPVALTAQATTRGTLALKGTLALTALRFAGLDTQASLRTPALAGLRPVFGPSLPALTDVTFDGQVSLPADRALLRVKAAKLQTAQGDLSGDGTLGFGNKLSLAGSWHSSRLDLDAALAAFGIDLAMRAAPAATSGPVIPATPLPWAALLGPSLDLDAAVDELSFADATWQNVRFALKLAGGALSVGPVRIGLPSGPAQVSLTADASGARPVSLVLNAPSVPLALLGRFAGLPGPMRGTVRLGAQLRAAGRTVRDLAASLEGPFSIAAVDGQVSNAALLALAAAPMTTLGITIPPQGQSDLECFGLGGSFAKGVGTLRTIALESTYLSVEGIGQVDLARETVAFRLTPLAQVSGAPVAVPVVVEGPFRNIAGRLDANGLQQLGLFIDGLFGGDTSTACDHAGLQGRRR